MKKDKPLKWCESGQHFVPALFHAKRKDRKSACALHAERKPIKKRNLIEEATQYVQTIAWADVKIKSAIAKVKPKPIPKVSSKQFDRLKLYSAAKKQYFIEHPTCEYPGCSSDEKTLHHMAGRIGDLLFDKRYFKTLCPSHHEWVERNPESAKEIGLSTTRIDK